jgi:predicted RNA-binding Zn ribbon-like protein
MLDSPSTSANSTFLMVGGDLSLDFVNTLLVGDDGRLRELLDSPDVLTAWCAASGMFDDAALRRFRTAWNRPKAGASALERARALRSELASIAQRVIAGKTYAHLAATALTPYLADMLLRRIATVENGRLGTSLRVDDSTDPINEFLGTIASSALELLAHADPERIRKCANPNCVVIFHDTTKNHRRQWCCMAACGNRAKAARFRERHDDK